MNYIDSQIFSDKSGTGESSFISNHTTLGESHYKEELVSKFSSEIIRFLTKLHSSGDLDSLTLICGPKFLGEFRKKITPSLKSLITSELSKNFYTEEPYKLKVFLDTHNIALVD